MSKYTKFIAIAALSLTLVQPAFAEEPNVDTVVATVNGKDITIGHMIVLQDSLPDQYRSLEDEVLFNGLLDQMIQQSVLSEHADASGKAIALHLENQRRQSLSAMVLQDIVEKGLTDEAIQAAYDMRFANEEPVPEFNASHILVETEEEAKALVVELDGGAEFANLAKEKSTGPSGPNGGELGWFGPGMMVKPFEDAVTGMKAGDISAPIQTQFGWHVIILNDTRLKEKPTLEELRPELEDGLRGTIIDAVLEGMVAEADVIRTDITTIDPSIIRNSDMLDE